MSYLLSIIADHRPLLRYAAGSTLMVAIAMAFQWPLAFILPILSLSFLGPGPSPDLKAGFLFVVTILTASLVGMGLSQQTLAIPFLQVLLTFGLLVWTFYTNHPRVRADLKVWLLIAIILIPNIALLSKGLAEDVAYSLVFNASLAILLTWLVYTIIPYRAPTASESAASKTAPEAQVPTKENRFTSALTQALVILPLYLLFYYFELTSSILILIFVAMLSMQPGFAKDFKAGKALIIGNLIGGLVAIAVFELLVVVPSFGFFLLLVFACGLILGSQLFSGKPASPLYGMAYSTFLLVICSVTADGAKEADSKVWMRVLQIMTAVTYVVTAFGLIQKFKKNT